MSSHFRATPALALSLALAVFSACAAKAPNPTGSPERAARESAILMSNPPEYGDRPISAEAGAAYFLETGGGDPYATGMAYPVFLALMDAYPEELGANMAAFREKFGFYPHPAHPNDPSAIPLGFHLTVDPETSVPWLVANCQMCHAERLRLESGDVIVAGLGNHRVRPHAYGSALVRIGAKPSLDEGRIEELATARARAMNIPFPEAMREPIVKATLLGLAEGSRKKSPGIHRYEAALPGRMATIESFALALAPYTHKTITLGSAIGWAKVPDVRGFPYRETLSFDGSGIGSPETLTLEADFLFGARPEWYASHRHIATSMYLFLKGFSRRLPYAGKVDARLASEGQRAFTSKCAECHGHYVDHGGGEMRVSYKERVVPQAMVGTDPARADAVTPSFAEVANAMPLTQGLTRVAPTGGYVPPVLLDVWARGLYGHAGQWPSLEVMATPPDQRPALFVVDTEGRYDLGRVGVRYEAVKKARALRPGEYLYDGTKPGASVIGHPYLADLPADSRRAVIEYLKTL